MTCMTDSIDRSIIQLKLSCPFVVLAIFTLYYTVVFQKKLGVSWQKTANIRRFFLTLVLIDCSKLSIECVPMDRWPLVREGFYDRLSIPSIKNIKSLTNGLITSMKMRPKVSIDTIGIDPSPIVPSYGCIKQWRGSQLHMWQLVLTDRHIIQRTMTTSRHINSGQSNF